MRRYAARVTTDQGPRRNGPALLALAGLDPAALRPVEPDFVPSAFGTERLAWELSGSAWRVRAAGVRGHPVQFQLLDGERSVGWGPSDPAGGVFAYVMLGLTAAAAFVGWNNLRRRRGDLAGALVVGAFALVTHLVLVFNGQTPTDVLGFGSNLMNIVSMSLHTAARVFVFYLALEPFARRRWPRSLISWTRLLEGRLGDPAVGREVLVGTFVGLCLVVVSTGSGLALEALGIADVPPFLSDQGLDGPIQIACLLLHGWGDTVMYAGLVLLLLVALRTLVRRPWLGNGLWLVLVYLLMTQGEFEDPLAALVPAVMLSAFLMLLTRLGFLAVVAFMATLPTIGLARSLRPADWQFSSGVVVLLALVALLTWAYRASVGGRSAFG